jgi:hypothetical protein
MSDKKIHVESLGLLLHVGNSHNYLPRTAVIRVANNADIRSNATRSADAAFANFISY